MKIGIVLRSCKAAGSSKYVIETAKEFVKSNDVHVFANYWDSLDNRVYAHKIPVIPGNFYMREASFMLFASAMMAGKKFDVTLAQPTRYFSPTVAEMQFVQKSWVEYRIANHMKITLGDRILPKIEKYNLKRCKMAIAISRSVADDIARLYNFPEEKTRVVYSGVDCEEFNPDNRKKYSEEIRKRHGIGGGEKIILFQGNPFDRKGLEYAIRALPLVRENAKLIVVGNDNIAPYMKIARELRVDKKIIHIPFTNEMKKYFAAADAFLLPSLYDTFALVVLEAMASGCGVVSSKYAGVSELIEDGKEGFVIDPKNCNDIAEKINIMLNSGSVFRKNARKKAEQCGWDKTAKKMLEVFEEVKG